MIVTIISVSVPPEKQQEFEQTAISLRDGFEKEKGCVRYRLLREVEGQPRYSLIGMWGARKAASQHFSSRDFSILAGAVKNLCEPPEMTFQITNVLNSGGDPAEIADLLNH